MLRLAFDFIITWRETRTRPNAYVILVQYYFSTVVVRVLHGREEAISNGLSDKENRMKKR